MISPVRAAVPPLDASAARQEPEPVAVSVILPTYNEAENIRAVLASTQKALRAIPRHEILVVDDDSPDRTWCVVDRLSWRDERIRCRRRINERGLASAIFDGLGRARGEVLVVMDADLQHDPGLVPQLVTALEDADLAVASRYAPGGSTATWSPARRWLSRVATWLGRRALGLAVTDPMSGFFAIRRRSFQAIAGRLRPRGFKALLEILSLTPDARVAEVPYRFRPRQAGKSKLGNEVILEYLLSLIELRTGRFISTRFVQYCLVGLSGVAVQLVSLVILQRALSEQLALALAILAAMLSNFVLNNAWTFRRSMLTQQAFRIGMLCFVGISTIGALLNHVTSLGFHRLTGVELVWSSLVGISLATLWNYKVNRAVTWGRPRGTAPRLELS